MISSNEPLDERIGDATADYSFTFEPHPHRVRGYFADTLIVDSDRVMVLRETRLPPVFYFPREHVSFDLMHPSDLRTHCPFKGNARYWTLKVDPRVAENVMWSYEEPLEDAKAIAGYVAFYTNLLDRWLEDDVELPDAERPRIAEFRNPLLNWLLTEAPHSQSATSLTESLCRQMAEVGIPIWRCHVIIRTLHPQLMAVSYRWWRKGVKTEEVFVPYEMMRKRQFLDSPLVSIFQGAGGIRRRLDVPEPVLDYPILRDLHGEGATDYVAMPLVFSDGQINVLTLASARRGGFSTSDLGSIYEILAVLGRLYEVHAMRYRTSTLLDTYLGRHAGSRVLDGLIKRGDGEDIESVIWFCDLRESTPLARSMPRRQFLSLLDEFFDCMAGAVLDHDGQVLRFIGDAALAIFPVMADSEETSRGATQARERAIQAAVSACDRLKTLNARRAVHGRTNIRYGIGLHQGEVTYGNIGTENRLEFTVIGDAANRAARIESMCKTLQKPVLASHDVAADFPEHFESLGRHALRGVDEPLELFALKGVSDDAG